MLVPVYGVEKYVAECVDSIFAQTYKNIEVIFVNDCTPDNSRKIIEQKIKDNPQINARVIDNPINLGSASTRNILIKESSGEYLFFVDSDDIIPANAINSIVKRAIETDADIIRGNIKRFSNISQSNFSQQFPEDIIQFRIALLDWGKFPLGVCGGAYKKSLFTQNNLTFYPNLNFGEDFGINTRLAYCAKSVSVVNETVYLYRVNASSMTQVYTEKNAISIIEISNRIKEYYERVPNYVLYRDALNRGRARIKTIMLLQLPPELMGKYTRVFPDLKTVRLPKYLRTSLWTVEHEHRTLYKILNRLKPIFHHT